MSDPWEAAYEQQGGLAKVLREAQERTDRIRQGLAGTSQERGDPPSLRLVRSAREAEEVCADWIKWMGFSDAAPTPIGTDGGIDVTGHGPSGKVCAQVKFEAVKAGRPKVQGLYGAGVAMGADVCAFFSSAGYTVQAKEWANQVDIALFEFALDGSVVPVNEPASRLFNA